MNEWLSAVLTVFIGAMIGGITNHLAVRMLFRPYRPWMLGGFRIPFTPGLIPRRREELARQMGHLVEHYLLTVEGIKRALAAGEIEQMIAARLTRYRNELRENKQSLRDLLRRFAPNVLDEDGQLNQRLRQFLQDRWEEWRGQWLTRVGERRLREILPEGVVARWDKTAASLGALLLVRLREYLRSPEGAAQLQKMLREMLGGGMFAGLLGMFLADDKLISRLQPLVDNWLDSPQLAAKLSDVIRQEADNVLDKHVQDVLNWIGEEQLTNWRRQAFAKLEEQGMRVLDKPLCEWLDQLPDHVWDEGISRIAAWIVLVLEENLERLLRKLEITKIVARQVEGFPLERVEEMVIGITGKEFRMITLLGFLLGGAIGLIQALLNVWL